MYLDTCKVRSGNKVYTRVLLRESYREHGQVKHELARRWQTLDLTVQEGLKKLSTLCVIEVELADQTSCLTIPEPSADVAKLIELAGVRLPTVFRSRGVKVATRRKLPENRSSRQL